MSSPAADRNLLFGILALQNDFITRDQLVEAMNAWVLAKQTPLGEILKRRDFLDDDCGALLGALVEKQIALHQGDVAASIAALSSVTEARAALKSVDDDEVQTTIQTLLGTDPAMVGTISYFGKTPDQSGRFTILRPHAAGGLGEVFVANDNELNREVALKQIKERHADSAPTQTRFVLEAEITGGLEHPGIVPVYSLGHYADGRPFYAMRFIRGDSLKEAIDDFHKGTSTTTSNPQSSTPDFNSLQFRSLLRRFVDVCNAIAYAHSRAVLHRDLKPGNIMLGKYGETLVVDWGLAKALGKHERSDGETMSPLVPSSGSNEGTDQTKPGSALGTPAYMSPEQAEGKLDQLGPPTDVYSLGATLYTVLTGNAPFRGANNIEVMVDVRNGRFPMPNILVASIPKPLEAICLKAMSLKPTDRHTNTLDLAAEIECWLADEPVKSFAEPLAARTRRWMRKHPGPVAGVVATVLVGLASLAVGLGVVGAKNRALETAKTNLQTANADLTLARDKAEIEFRRSKTAVDDYFTAVSESKELKEKYAGMHEFRIKLLNKAEHYYKEFLNERGNDPNLQSDAAQAYFHRALVANEIGRKADARASHEAALAIREQLARDDPTRSEYASALASSHHKLGTLQSEMGETNAALASFAHAQAIRENLTLDNPAVTVYAKDLVASHNNLGLLRYQSGNPQATLANFRKAQTISEKLALDHPAETAFATILAAAHTNIGNLQFETGDTPAALASHGKALAINEKLAREHPSVTEYATDVAASHSNLGNLQCATGDANAALASHGVALAILEKLTRDNPAVIDFANRLAQIHNNLAVLQSDIGATKAALASFGKALTIYEKLARDNPTVTAYTVELGGVHGNIGSLVSDSSSPQEALKHFEKAIALLGNAKVDASGRINLRNSHSDRASALVRLGRLDEAIADFDAALKFDDGSKAAAINKDRDAALANKAAKAKTAAKSPDTKKAAGTKSTEKQSLPK